MNVGNWLYKRSLYSGDKTAIVFDNRTLTYAQLNERTNRLARALLDMGLDPGDRVGAYTRNRPEFLEVYFACAKAGLIFVSLNFRLAPPEVAYQVGDSGLKVLCFEPGLGERTEKCLALLKPDHRPVCLAWGREAGDWHSSYEGALDGRPDSEPSVGPARDDLDKPQMIMYTSGTTGTPKGALLSHRKTLFNTLNAQIYFDLYSRDVMLVTLPLFHSGGLNIMSVPILYVGGTLVLEDHFDPFRFLNLIETHRVTQSMLVPTMLNTLLKETRPRDRDIGSLRTIVVAGEPASADLMHEALDNGLPVRQLFGQTETSIELWVPEDKAREKAGAVGLPVLHGDVRVVDEEGRPVPPGGIGEIVVQGPIRMTAYWNRPEETGRVSRNGWHHTGDLARVDEDGYIYAVDRMGDMFISGGENIYPAEVEKVLLMHPKIFEAAIIGVPHERWGRAGHAYVSLKPGQSLDYEEMAAFLRERVATYKIPKFMEIIDELPKTASGKIKKSELKKRE
ncbi:MAG: long-chain fatty acid--CoA ligase [Proteobacteria bacterium]|nr:long-chain fatty acid--CoA ligase [Pseudomonadota bacterium]